MHFPLIQTQPVTADLLSVVFLRDFEVISRWTALGSAIIMGSNLLTCQG